jgi:outer membrane beta-barrel protein
MKKLASILLVVVAAALLLPGPALAAKRKTKKTKEEKTDVKLEEVGVLRNEDVRVVQKNLYVKRNHHEIGFMFTTQPWDVYAAGVMAGIDITFNPSEIAGIEIMVQGGYGWGTGHWRDVTFLGEAAAGQLSSLGSDAARQLVGGSVNFVWSPIYAKLAWGRRHVLHFDVYGTLGAHGYLAQRLEADQGFMGVYGPSVGLGLKFFLSRRVGLKIDLRDHISLETRTYTGKFTARNNFQFGIGLTFFTGERD